MDGEGGGGMRRVKGMKKGSVRRKGNVEGEPEGMWSVKRQCGG